MTTAATKKAGTMASEILHVAFELGRKKWLLGFTIGLGQKPRKKSISGGDLAAVKREIAAAKRRFGLAEDARVVSCYEAGPEGFWLHRWLVSIGVQNVVVDSASIEVDRRKRRAKSDGLDVEGLLKLMCRHTMGEARVWSVVRVPPPQIEDIRQLHRDLATLTEERTRIRNRIRGLLAAQGVAIGGGWSKLSEKFERIRLWDGSMLGEGLRRRLEREVERMQVVQRQISEITRMMNTERKEQAQPDSALWKMQRLASLRGIGVQGARILVIEQFAWREFRNRRQVGGCTGLTPTPYQSGNSSHEQGIDKAGSIWVRRVATQLAWSWIRWQPNSEITKWFNRKFAGAGRRMRRVGIVAVARKMMIALWRYTLGAELPGAVTGEVDAFVLKAA